MENILTVISIISLVVFFIFMFFGVRYLKKHTLFSLIGNAVSSVGICALEIATIIIKSNLDKSYKMNVACLCIFAIDFLLAVILLMGEWFDRHKKIDITIEITDTDDEDAESK